VQKDLVVSVNLSGANRLGDRLENAVEPLSPPPNKALELPASAVSLRGSILAASDERRRKSVSGRQLNADPLGSEGILDYAAFQRMVNRFFP
jgi:hypothetical protein